MKKAIIVLVSISVFAFFLPATHTSIQKTTQVAVVNQNIDPIYPPIG